MMRRYERLMDSAAANAHRVTSLSNLSQTLGGLFSNLATVAVLGCGILTRDDRRYRSYRLGRIDRIYRGSDNRYYCRRDDGTTGLIVGGIAGGLLGNLKERTALKEQRRDGLGRHIAAGYYVAGRSGHQRMP